MSVTSAVAARVGRRKSWTRRVRPEVAVVYGLLVVLVVWGAVSYPTFRTSQNLTNVLEQSIVLGLVAIGQAVVMIGGGLDMSVGAIVKVNVLVGAILMNGHNSSIGSIALLLCAMGIVFGIANGLVIAWLRAAPFIVTFASFFLLVGMANLISTTPVGMAPPALVSFYSAKWLGVPLPILLMALVWILSWAALRNTVWSRHLFAVGGRPEVAALAGIRANRIRVATYALSGLFAALAALFTLSINGIGDPQAGDNLQFLSITAAAVGGVSLLGGRGSLVGVLGGVLLLTLVSDLLQIAHVNTFYEQPLQGLIIIIAVALYRSRKQQV